MTNSEARKRIQAATAASTRGTPIELLTEGADTQHTVALTWREAGQVLKVAGGRG